MKRLSFLIQFITEFLLPFTSCRKVLGKCLILLQNCTPYCKFFTGISENSKIKKHKIYSFFVVFCFDLSNTTVIFISIMNSLSLALSDIKYIILQKFLFFLISAYKHTHFCYQMHNSCINYPNILKLCSDNYAFCKFIFCRMYNLPANQC